MFGRRVSSDNLESLQRDSWQLELLITGFALAGMVSGLEEYNEWSSRMLRGLKGGDIGSEIAQGLLVFTNFAYLITLINFFVHVVIRCLWIGAIGSRSVMGDTVMVRRRLAPKFARFLQRRSGNFDAYIRRLDDAASLVFAFTFLLIIVAVSFLSFTLVLAGAATGLLRLLDHPVWLAMISLAMALYSLVALVYVADFLSAGYLKRFGWLSRVYYPFYRLFGWITLARLYRPLYYNLLNRRVGRWLVFLLIPYLVVSLGLLSLEIVPNSYVAAAYLSDSGSSGMALLEEYYEDGTTEGSGSGSIVLPAQVVRTSPLPVRLPLLSNYESYTKYRCPDLPLQYANTLVVVKKGKSGTYRDGQWSEEFHTELTRDALDCLTSALEVFLDGRRVALDDVLLRESPSRPGAEVVKFLPIDTLSTGLHRIRLRQLEAPSPHDPTDTLHGEITVPFYYAPGR